MVRKVSLSFILLSFLSLLFITSTSSSANIEFYDIEKGEIVHLIPPNPKTQSEVENLLNNIDQIVKKFNPIPNDGYMVKIPLDPAVLLENERIYAKVDEVIVIIPKWEDPSILIFDEENTAHFFTLKTTIDSLLDSLDFSF